MGDLSYGQQVLDVTGKVVVMHTTRTHSLTGAEATAKALREAGASLVVIITDGTTIRTLDEDQMREAGWVRA